MNFDWDEIKNDLNIRWHKIDLTDVKVAFQYPMVIKLDEREDYGEDRWVGLGLMNNLIVVIVYTEPEPDTIRLISARKANKHERQHYEQTVGY